MITATTKTTPAQTPFMRRYAERLNELASRLSPQQFAALFGANPETRNAIAERIGLAAFDDLEAEDRLRRQA
jgi:hypothetical protein